MTDRSMIIPRSEIAEQERRQKAEAFMWWLNHHGYSYAAFAARCKIHTKRVQDWARGYRSPPILLPIVLEMLEEEHVRNKRNAASHQESAREEAPMES